MINAPWTVEDTRKSEFLARELGPVRVISHEENRMTEQATEMEQDYDGEADGQIVAGGATYPEHSYKLADHVYTWSPKLPDGSMLVFRSQSASGLVQAVKDMGPLAGQLRAAWQDVVGAPQAPAQGGFPQQTAATPPPFGPNVSAPQAPGYQGPPAPQAPQWGGQQQAPAQQWGGGQPQQAQSGQKPAYPAPQGWYKLNVPYPKGTEQLHALATQLQIPKGNPSKGGVYNFFGLSPSGAPGKAWYCAPEAAHAFAQFTPMPA